MTLIKNTVLYTAGKIAASAPGRSLQNKYPVRSKGDASRGGNSLRIFNYHRVLFQADEFAIDAIDAKLFEQQINVLKTYFTVLPLDTAAVQLKNNSLPENAVCVTFDDGYRDNYDVAFPILQKYNAPATIYLATDFIGTGKVLWHDSVLTAFKITHKSSFSFPDFDVRHVSLNTLADRKKAAVTLLEKLKKYPPNQRNQFIKKLHDVLRVHLQNTKSVMLDWTHIRDMHQSMISFGAHTKSHPILSTLDDQSLREEIVDSKNCVENYLQAPVESFAYPNGRPGDYDHRSVSFIEQAGFTNAVTTVRGLNNPSQNLFELMRVSPWETNPVRFHGRLYIEHFTGAMH